MQQILGKMDNILNMKMDNILNMYIFFSQYNGKLQAKIQLNKYALLFSGGLT